MSETKASYYQFRQSLNYQIFIKFDDLQLEASLAETLEVMGFDKLEPEAFKNMEFKRYKTKILKISKASLNVARQISQTTHSNDRFGVESLNKMGSYNIYRYKDVGMMVYSEINPMWELGLKSTINKEAMRCIMTRFLSFAFTATQMEVVGFWGVPVDEGLVIMSPKKANYESVFIDITKNLILTYGSDKSIESEIEILRLDQTLSNDIRTMAAEELLGFLSVSTCHMSYSELDQNIKETLYKIRLISKGFIYPEENFRPRVNPSQAA